jgi:hypothetical protein
MISRPVVAEKVSNRLIIEHAYPVHLGSSYFLGYYKHVCPLACPRRFLYNHYHNHPLRLLPLLVYFIIVCASGVVRPVLYLLLVVNSLPESHLFKRHYAAVLIAS